MKGTVQMHYTAGFIVFRFTGDEDDPYGSLTTRRDYAYEP